MNNFIKSVMFFCVLGSGFLANIAFGEQEWVSNPVVVSSAMPDAAETACLTTAILKQDTEAKGEKIFIAAPIADSANYHFLYCTMDESGHAKKCSYINFITRDPKGWQVVEVDGNSGYLIAASDMGVEAQVTDAKTQMSRYVFDARDCMATILKGVRPVLNQLR